MTPQAIMFTVFRKRLVKFKEEISSPSSSSRTVEQPKCYICLDTEHNCMKLHCKHHVHKGCLQQQITQLSNKGEIISPRYGQCGLCGEWIKDWRLPRQARELVKKVRKKSKDCLDTFLMYRCYICGNLFVSEKPACANDIQIREPSPDIRCERCKDACAKHGLEFLSYKCHCCCSIAKWQCGSVYFCDACHLIQKPKPCVGSQGGCYFDHPENGTVTYIFGCVACMNDSM